MRHSGGWASSCCSRCDVLTPSILPTTVPPRTSFVSGLSCQCGQPADGMQAMGMDCDLYLRRLHAVSRPLASIAGWLVAACIT